MRSKKGSVTRDPIYERPLFAPHPLLFVACHSDRKYRDLLKSLEEKNIAVYDFLEEEDLSLRNLKFSNISYGRSALTCRIRIEAKLFEKSSFSCVYSEASPCATLSITVGLEPLEFLSLASKRWETERNFGYNKGNHWSPSMSEIPVGFLI